MPTITIPTLASWPQAGTSYSLLVDSIGYLDLTATATGYQLCVRPYEDSIPSGPAQVLAERTTAAQLVDVARQLFTSGHDQPVKHNTFQ